MLTSPRTSSTSSPHSRTHRNRALDGARAVSALLVVAHHCAAPAAGGTSPGLLLSKILDVAGHAGVAVLFMLSGSLLFREFVGPLLFDEPPTPIPHYVERRFLRIYPAYWLSLLGCVLVIGSVNLRGSVFGLLTLTERFTNTTDEFPGLAVYWTLSVEIAFYVFLPIFAAILSRVIRRRTDLHRRIRTLLLALAGLVAVTPIYIGLIASSHHGDVRINALLPSYIGWFGLGMVITVLAELRSRGVSLPRSLVDLADRTWACWTCTTIAVVGMILLRSGRAPFTPLSAASTLQTQIWMALMGAGAFFFLLPLCLGRSDRTGTRVLGSSAMVWIGSVSYGLYLWHMLVIVFIRQHTRLPGGNVGFAILFTLTLIPSLVIGWLSSRLVEQPALRLAR